MASDALWALLDNVITLALEEGVELRELEMALHDRYIDLDITESGEAE